jgi:lactate dehydrogenase-like 2-hydroxyacid dehydrogenase
MSKAKIVSFLSFPHEFQKTWFDSRDIPENDLFLISSGCTDAEICDQMTGADIIIKGPGMPFFNREILSTIQDTKLIQFASVGYAPIDLPASKELGIPVANNPGINSITVAEHAVMFILVLKRWAAYAHIELLKGRKADLGIPPNVKTGELYGKTVGILGLGDIGKQVAERLQCFGVRILYNKRNRLSPMEEEKLGVEYRSFNQILEDSDVLTLHLPLSDETNGMIGREQIQMMKKGAILVNTARRQIVDEDALIEALRDDHLAGAAMDVPLEEGEIAQLGKLYEGIPNLMFTPHTASMAPEVGPRAIKQIKENVERVFRNEKPLHIVN